MIVYAVFKDTGSHHLTEEELGGLFTDLVKASLYALRCKEEDPLLFNTRIQEYEVQ